MSVRSSRLLLTLSLVVAFGLAAQARAADKDDKAAAREHYEKGTSFYDLGRYPEAIKEFEAAYELKKDPALLFNLAQAYRLAGNAEQALHFYKTYLRYVPRPPNKAEIDDRIAALEKQVAEHPQTQTQPPPAADATAPPPPPPPLATTPPAAPPPPTPAPPAAEAPPQVTVQSSSPPPSSEVATPPNLLTSTPAPPQAAPSHGHQFQLAGIITGGVGAVLLVAAMVEGARAKSASNEVQNEAKTGTPFDPSIESRGKSAEKAQWTFLTLGLLAGGGGAALWFYGRHVDMKAAEQSGPRVSFAPVLAPTGAGAMLRMRF
jgi:hypothetical protein